MKATVFTQYGGPDVLRYVDMPDPVAQAGEVVVDVYAASVNGADYKVRCGDPGHLELWADSGLVEIPARTTDEARWVVVGKIDQKHWSAVITRRGENVRLISVRRSRDEEVAIYESEDI
jgi:uncharacterized protein